MYFNFCREELVSQGVLHSCVTSMLMRLRRPLRGSTVCMLVVFTNEWFRVIECVSFERTNFNYSGRMVDGREITVQFAKYGPNAERM